MSERGRTLFWRSGGLALLGYFALTLALLGPGILSHLDSSCLCTESSDPTQFVWTMVWWPHAIGSGVNPFLTHSIWAPGPFDLATATSVPLAAIVATPVTLTIGPLASYNLFVLLCPTLAAFFAFRLCHYVTGRIAPSLVGGFIFGFSGYMFGQMIGHLNLMLIFLVPLGVHITLRRIDGVIGRRRFVLSIAALIAAQALLSTEILFTALIFGGIALAAGALFADSEGRARIRRTTIEVLAGGATGAIVISPFLYYALFYTSQPTFLSVARFSMDALNPLVPTPVQRIGRTTFAPVAGTFPGGYAEAGGYIGIAMVLLAGWWLSFSWRRGATRVMLVVLTCSVVGALGTALYISGHPTISLPWKALAHIPLMHEVIPVRLAMYSSLVIAVAVAQALAAPVGSPVLRWSLAVVGVVMLLPSGRSPLFHSNPPDPAFFTTGQYKSYIGREETVLALPYSQRGQSLLWQARTGMWFRLAGGYLGQVPPKDYGEEPAVTQLLTGVANPETPCLLKSFIERRGVSAVVIESTSTEPWRPALARLGIRSKKVGGVDFYRIPEAMTTPAGCT